MQAMEVQSSNGTGASTMGPAGRGGGGGAKWWILLTTNVFDKPVTLYAMNDTGYIKQLK